MTYGKRHMYLNFIAILKLVAISIPFFQTLVKGYGNHQEGKVPDMRDSKAKYLFRYNH